METQYLCRVGFCKTCFEKGFPQYNQKFISCGTHGYHVDHADFSKHDIGYTPHLYKLVKTLGNVVLCETVCCMEGCSIVLTPSTSKPNAYEFTILQSFWKESRMLVSDWNALKKFKRDPAYII